MLELYTQKKKCSFKETEVVPTYVIKFRRTVTIRFMYEYNISITTLLAY